MLNKSKIVILGARGMLGTDLVKTCREKNLDIQAFDLPEFNITNFEQLKKTVNSADIVINCAAYTNVDGAENDKELAYEINAEAVGHLGSLAKDNNIWVLHISTDFVFDGRQEKPYVETDLPNPINEYGRSKLAGEKLLSQSGCNYCIMRVEWTYGSWGNNFVSKLIQRARTNDIVNVVDDQVGSPTETKEVSNVICKLIDKKPVGLLHFANSGYVSRYEMAGFIFDNLLMNVNLVPCKTSDYVLPAARPLNSRFDCSKISALLDEKIQSWQIVLERFLNNL